MDLVMSIKKLLVIVLIFSFAANLQAHKKSRKHRTKHRSNSKLIIRYNTFPRWHNNSYYGNYLSYRPVNVNQRNMVLADADLIIEQIEKLKELQDNGVISAKEFTKAKKRLLKRIGELIPKNEQKNSTEAVIQLEKLYELEQREILTEKEYNKQKKKILNLI